MRGATATKQSKRLLRSLRSLAMTARRRLPGAELLLEIEMAWMRPYNRKGQLAPFMLAVIVILLIAIMVTVNLGKISLTKTNTANAADAGALAGASTMANGLNAIKDISAQMFADYIATQVALRAGTCRMQCWQAWIIYIMHLVSEIALYAYARKIARDTLKQAKESSLQLAFSNAGITEAKPRECKSRAPDGSCAEQESWEDWTTRDSPFEQWMQSGGYASGSYSWPAPKKYGQSSAGAQINSVTVTSNPPSWSVIPSLSIITFTVLVDPCPAKGSCCLCPGGGPTLMGIAKVTGDTRPIRLSVSRVEPDTNLGLWGMRYRKAGEAGITSTSGGRAYGGSVGPFGSDYDSELNEAN